MALNKEQNEALALVHAVAFLNPFGRRRQSWEEELGDLVPGKSQDDVRERLHKFLDELLEEIFKTHKSISSFQEIEREYVETACLFAAFLRYRKQFDDFIAAQLETTDNLKLPFTEDFHQELKRFGMPDSQIWRYLAIFFQLRRAYYFIGRLIQGQGESVSRLREQLWQNVFTEDSRLYNEHLWNRMEDFSTLLLGETGTGKGNAAAAIGQSGFIPFDPKKSAFKERFTSAFVAINLAEYPENLIESELFGHRKGAFTGAVDGHDGIFQRCSPYGALFLDEIGDVSLPLQVKLLRTLQERTFAKVGSHEKLRFQGRIIAATNRDVRSLVEEGKMRTDFYYRLCSHVIAVPPLRTRLKEAPAELTFLVKVLLERLTGTDDSKLVQRLQHAITETLPAHYHWPGNIRELEQCLRQLLVTSSYYPLGSSSGDREDIPVQRAFERLGQTELTAEGILAGICQRLYAERRSYEAVGRQLALDRRTVKRYCELALAEEPLS